MRHEGVAGAAILSLVFGVMPGVSAQVKTIRDGVYTVVQAARGENLYMGQCSSCHGADLTGTTEAPGLAGEAFLGAWDQSRLSDLFDKIRMSMPARSPGTLSQQDTADLVAYMLSVGKFSGGQSDLSSDPDTLKSITIVK